MEANAGWRALEPGEGKWSCEPVGCPRWNMGEGKPAESQDGGGCLLEREPREGVLNFRCLK